MSSPKRRNARDRLRARGSSPAGSAEPPKSHSADTTVPVPGGYLDVPENTTSSPTATSARSCQVLEQGRQIQRTMSGILQEAAHRVHVKWSSEKEALGGVDVLRGQLLTLAGVLDAFSDGFEA